jgi:hypothetical protein
MVVFKFIILRLHLTIPLGANNILPCLPFAGAPGTFHLFGSYYRPAFRLSGALIGEGIDVQRFDRSYGSHAVAAIFVPIVHKTFLK